VRLVYGRPVCVPCKPDFTEADVDALQMQFYAELAATVDRCVALFRVAFACCTFHMHPECISRRATQRK
jgi:hypothetical protein